MTTEEILDLLPEDISVLNDNPTDEWDNEIWYGFELLKEDGKYTLSYYNSIRDDFLVSFSDGLHEVASKMYEWCKGKGYIK